MPKITALPPDSSPLLSSDILPLVTLGVTESITAQLMGLAGGTNKSVLFYNSSGNLSQDANYFTYDSTNHHLTLTGTYTAIDSNSAQQSILFTETFSPSVVNTSASFSLSCNETFNVATGKTIVAAGSLSINPIFVNGGGSITTWCGVVYTAYSGNPVNVVNAYTGYFGAPGFGSSSQVALYADNLAIGFGTTTPPSTGAFIRGQTVIGATSANNKALLAITSTTQGFLPPSMTTTQKNAISSPPSGLVVYDNTLNDLQFYNGSSWASSTGVLSIAGTANQINTSSSAGAVTLSLSSTIVTPGTFSANGSLATSSSITLNATSAYNTVLRGTQTAVDGSSNQIGFYNNPTLNPTNGGNILYGIFNNPVFFVPTGKTIASAYGLSIAPNYSSNLGSISNAVTLHLQAGSAASGSLSNNFTFYCSSPTSGSQKYTAYFDPGVGIGDFNDVTSSAILLLSSTTQGFLPPSMSTTEKNSISSPASGLVVYDNTLNDIQYYNGSSWVSSTGVTSVSGTTNRITVSPTTGNAVVDISGAYVGQSSITTLGTISTGTWTATAINLSSYASGTLQAAQFPALSNDVTTSAGSLTTTIKSNVNLSGNPTTTTQATTDNSTRISTTAYVTTAISNAIAAVNPAVAVQAATTSAGNTSAWTYVNGALGIGATFTAPINTVITIDGFTFTAVNQRLLIKNDTQSPSGAFNGVYYLSALHTAGTGDIYIRALDYDQPSDINNTGAIPVVNGTVNALSSWLLTSTVNTVGTDPLTYAQFSVSPTAIVTSAQGTAPIQVNATSGTPQVGAITISLSTPVSLANGGTNASLVANNGGIVWSNGTQLQILSGTATASKMLLSGATATPSWSTSTIPTSAGATANKVLLSDGTNYVLSTPTFPNTSATSGKIIISDGTNWVTTTTTYPSTNAINTIMYSSSANVLGVISASNNGVLISGTTGIPSWLSAGTTGQVLVATTSNPATWSTLSGIAVTTAQGTAPIQVNGASATPVSGAITISVTNATTSNVGVASFNTTNFSVSAGAVTSQNFTITAGTGLSGGGSLTLGGSVSLANAGVLSVSGTTNRITVSPTTGNAVVDIAATYAGQTSIANLGTVLFGTWNASIIPLAYGGTNANLTASNGGIVWSNATQMQILSGTATAGKVLQSGATAAPSWSTPTYPSASGSAGVIIRSDGTNNVYSTSTFSDTYSANNLLYSNGANTVTGLATANQGVLTTNGSGVPVITALGTNGQLIIGSTAGVPAAATLTQGSGITITNGSNSITIAATGGSSGISLGLGLATSLMMNSF